MPRLTISLQKKWKHYVYCEIKMFFFVCEFFKMNNKVRFSRITGILFLEGSLSSQSLRGLVVRINDSHGNGPGSIPGPGTVQPWLCVLINVVMPRRSNGTLNRCLVCVAHHTWTVKIPTVTEEAK